MHLFKQGGVVIRGRGVLEVLVRLRNFPGLELQRILGVSCLVALNLKPYIVKLRVWVNRKTGRDADWAVMSK